MPGAGNSQAWNRFSYVLGNPILYKDPYGHRVSCGDVESATCGGDTIDYLEWAYSKGSIEEKEYLLRGAVVVHKRSEYWNKYSSIQKSNVQNKPQSRLPKDEIIPPWDINRLDGVGIKVNTSGIYVIGIGVSLDILINARSREIGIVLTPNFLTTTGAGVDASIGVALFYDTPNIWSISGSNLGMQGNFTLLDVGVQTSYTTNPKALSNGEIPQSYKLSYSTGFEASLGSVVGYSFPLFIFGY